MRMLVVLAAATLLATAADRPDLTGTWKLNASKSDFGGNPVPAQLSIKVWTEGKDLRVTQTTDQGTMEFRFNDRGEEATNELPNGSKMISVHKWEGKALVGDMKFDFGTQRDVNTFSEDGKTWTTEREFKGDTGTTKMKFVFEKQAS